MEKTKAPVAKAKPTTLEAVILDAIKETGQSVYAVAKGAGVSQPVVHRFVAGERGINLDTAEKLCRFLGLVLVRREG